MAGIKGMQSLTKPEKAWDIKVQIPRDEWKMIRAIADESSTSMANVMRVAWRRFYAGYQRMDDVEKAGLWMN